MNEKNIKNKRSPSTEQFREIVTNIILVLNLK